MEQPPESVDTRPWLCVRTQTKREQIAVGQLKRLEGVDVFCPRIRFRRNTRRGRVWFEEALFPGYLFARFDFKTMIRAVSGTVGVRGLVRFDGECAHVPGFVVEMLRAEMADGPVILVKEPELKIGDETVLIGGALTGLRAVITRVMPGGDRIKVLMDMMGTAVEAEVSRDALEKVA